LFHGFWYTLAGLKIERVKRSEYGEAYRLYALGTRYGLTDRGVGGAGYRMEPSESVSPQGLSAKRSRRPAPLREHPAAREANPFH